MSFRRLIAMEWLEEGEKMPRGYAVAWFDLASMHAVCLPVGFHVIAGWLRARYIWFKAYRVTNGFEDSFKRGYDQGHRAGILMGRDEGRQERIDAVSAARKEGWDAAMKALLDAVGQR